MTEYGTYEEGYIRQMSEDETLSNPESVYEFRLSYSDVLPEWLLNPVLNGILAIQDQVAGLQTQYALVSSNQTIVQYKVNPIYAEDQLGAPFVVPAWLTGAFIMGLLKQVFWILVAWAGVDFASSLLEVSKEAPKTISTAMLLVAGGFVIMMLSSLAKTTGYKYSRG